MGEIQRLEGPVPALTDGNWHRVVKKGRMKTALAWNRLVSLFLCVVWTNKGRFNPAGQRINRILQVRLRKGIVYILASCVSSPIFIFPFSPESRRGRTASTRLRQRFFFFSFLFFSLHRKLFFSSLCTVISFASLYFFFF